VCLPWGPTPMGDTPAYRRGRTVVTPAPVIAVSVIAGALRMPHCPKIGQNTDFQSGVTRPENM